jgi:hypothetical protein
VFLTIFNENFTEYTQDYCFLWLWWYHIGLLYFLFKFTFIPLNGAEVLLVVISWSFKHSWQSCAFLDFIFRSPVVNLYHTPGMVVFRHVVCEVRCALWTRNNWDFTTKLFWHVCRVPCLCLPKILVLPSKFLSFHAKSIFHISNFRFLSKLNSHIFSHILWNRCTSDVDTSYGINKEPGTPLKGMANCSSPYWLFLWMFNFFCKLNFFLGTIVHLRLILWEIKYPMPL